MGAEVVQLFVQSNRQWRLPERADEVYATYRKAADASDVVSETVVHAPYLINVISPDRTTARRSRASLTANLRAATALGASGLVLHPGSHRGVGVETAVRRIARALVTALDEAQAASGAVCDLLLENTAGAGGTMGRSFAELAAIIDASGSDDRLGICLDTQHLWASGHSYATRVEADAVMGQLQTQLGGGRLRCLHLNDSKVPLGANRDRDENLGEGYIGASPLRALLSHPDVQHLPAILEVPGIDGHGPGPADLARARSLRQAGLAARRRDRTRRRQNEGPG
jgi:deoxyribonuclease-4